ncbi:MAG: DUF302 domain-containing protein [Rhodospirillales bacterium]|nr:DUF302 domain-containing protein [Rhodospirillales bacterium]
MPARRHLFFALLLSLGLLAAARPSLAADNGMITVLSHHSVKQTIRRFEAAVRAKSALGFVVFGTIDHAAAARKAGLSLRPRTLIMYGTPKLGTPAMAKAPTLAIDLPMKALVWQDDAGKVWLTYNTAEYMGTTIDARHGLPNPPNTPKVAALLKALAAQATR